MTLLHIFTSVNNVLINWSRSSVFLFVNYLAVALERGYLVIKCHCHSVSSKLEVLDLHSIIHCVAWHHSRFTVKSEKIIQMIMVP